MASVPLSQLNAVKLENIPPGIVEAGKAVLLSELAGARLPKTFDAEAVARKMAAVMGSARLAMGIPRRLGRTQSQLILRMRLDNGIWYAGCGWFAGQTLQDHRRIMARLETYGLVRQIERRVRPIDETKIPKGIHPASWQRDNPKRRMWELTPLGMSCELSIDLSPEGAG